MFMRGLFQIGMTRKKEIPVLHNEERGLLFCLVKSSRLERELVAQCKLEYRVATSIVKVCNLCYTNIVTSI